MPHSNPHITDRGMASSCSVPGVGEIGKPRRRKLIFANDGVSATRRAVPSRATMESPGCRCGARVCRRARGVESVFLRMLRGVGRAFFCRALRWGVTRGCTADMRWGGGLGGSSVLLECGSGRGRRKGPPREDGLVNHQAGEGSLKRHLVTFRGRKFENFQKTHLYGRVHIQRTGGAWDIVHPGPTPPLWVAIDHTRHLWE